LRRALGIQDLYLICSECTVRSEQSGNPVLICRAIARHPAGIRAEKVVVAGILLVKVCSVTGESTHSVGRKVVRNPLIAIVFSAFAAGLAATPATATPAADPDGPIATVAVQPVPLNHRFPHEAVMVLVGAALIALGTAVRRSA
jgi:hypothetical protein